MPLTYAFTLPSRTIGNCCSASTAGELMREGVEVGHVDAPVAVAVAAQRHLQFVDRIAGAEVDLPIRRLGHVDDEARFPFDERDRGGTIDVVDVVEGLGDERTEEVAVLKNGIPSAQRGEAGRRD